MIKSSNIIHEAFTSSASPALIRNIKTIFTASPLTLGAARSESGEICSVDVARPRRKSSSNQAVWNALVPASMIGGATAVCSAALRHTSATITPLSLAYMFLLALQYSVQPSISKKYIDARAKKESISIIEEVVKMSMGLCMFLAAPKGVVMESLKGWSVRTSLMVAAIPSALYAIQGVLTYMSYLNLDAVTFNGLSQTKMLSAGICCFLILGKKQSLVQVLALALLFVSALLFQGLFTKVVNNVNASGEVIQEKAEDDTKLKTRRRFAQGVVPCLCAAFLSGLSGALSQKGLQVTGGTGRNAYLYTAEVSFFSGAFLLLPILLRRQRRAGRSVEDTQTSVSNDSGYFAYWTWQTLIPIVVKALGGVLTALVHKHAGSVLKGFSLVFGLVLSGTYQCMWDGKPMTAEQVLGTILVTLCTWMHLTNPPATSN